MAIEILCPVYRSIPIENAKKSLRYLIRRLLADLKIDRIEVLEIGERFALVKIQGEEKEIAYRYLEKIFGRRLDTNEIMVEHEYSGRVDYVNNEFMGIDIGQEKNIRIKIPTSSFIRKIIEASSLPNPARIIRLMGIDKYFPLVVKVVSIRKENQEKGIIGKAGRRTIFLFKRWFRDRLDRVIVYGELRSNLDKIVRMRKLFRKIIKIERLGFLEHSIICRYGVYADEVQKILQEQGIEKTLVFMPRRLKKMIKQNSVG